MSSKGRRVTRGVVFPASVATPLALFSCRLFVVPPMVEVRSNPLVARWQLKPITFDDRLSLHLFLDTRVLNDITTRILEDADTCESYSHLYHQPAGMIVRNYRKRVYYLPMTDETYAKIPGRKNTTNSPLKHSVSTVPG